MIEGVGVMKMEAVKSKKSNYKKSNNKNNRKSSTNGYKKSGNKRVNNNKKVSNSKVSSSKKVTNAKANDITPIRRVRKRKIHYHFDDRQLFVKFEDLVKENDINEIYSSYEKSDYEELDNNKKINRKRLKGKKIKPVEGDKLEKTFFVEKKDTIHSKSEVQDVEQDEFEEKIDSGDSFSVGFLLLILIACLVLGFLAGYATYRLIFT